MGSIKPGVPDVRGTRIPLEMADLISGEAWFFIPAQPGVRQFGNTEKIRRKSKKMAYVKLNGYMCERCFYVWAPKFQDAPEPKRCSKCSSQYWNTPRRKYVEARPNGMPRKRKSQARRDGMQQQVLEQEADPAGVREGAGSGPAR